MSQIVCNDFIWPMYSGLDTETNNNLISYHLAEDGIYCRKNVFGNKYIVYKEDKVADLPKVKEDLHPIKDCKIPSLFYHKTVEFFKYVYKHFGVWLEAFVIYGMTKEGKYFMYVPEQEVEPTHVHANLEDFYINNPGCYIVCDFHSHSNFNAFYSSTDTNDDVKGRYSGVIGNNQKVVPDVKCRFNYAGKYIDLTLDDIFEENDNYIIQDYNMEEWVKKLTRAKVTPVIIGQGVPFNNDNFGYGSMYGDFDPYDPNGYWESYGYHGRRDTNRRALGTGFQPVVEKCTQCGKFTKVADLFQLEAELLCQRCLTELGLGVE